MQAETWKCNCLWIGMPSRSFHAHQICGRISFMLSSRQDSSLSLLAMKVHRSTSGCHHMPHLRLLSQNQKLAPKLLGTARNRILKVTWEFGTKSLVKQGALAVLVFGLCFSFPSFHLGYAKVTSARMERNSSTTTYSNGKQVYSNYSVIGISGDGRCLFRSLVHGACIRLGKPAPDECLQRVLADDLRSRVADEFFNRRKETEWFIEGDFDTYVAQIRKPHVWGGEPELFIASHVLQMPITVFMPDENSGGLIVIAEYGREYGKENPIQVLYDGFGHYDALQIPRNKGSRSRL